MAKIYRTGAGAIDRDLAPEEVDANFRDSEAREQYAIDQLALKIPASEKDSANGIPTLNNEKKVVQTALNSDRVNGQTISEFSSTWQRKKLTGDDGTPLPTSTLTDMDDLLVSGFYYMGDSDVIANVPATSGDPVMTIVLGRTTSFVVQMMYYPDKVFVRTWTGAWDAWKQMLDTTGTAANASLLGGKSVGDIEAERNTAITTAINNLINGAPGALNALNELAAALGNDPNFATTMTNALAGKQSNLYDGFITNPGYDADTIAENKIGFTHANHAPLYGPLVHLSGSGYGIQFNGLYTDSKLHFRTSNAGAFNPWKQLFTPDDVVNNLTTNNGAVPVSAAQAKILNEKLVPNAYLSSNPVGDADIIGHGVQLVYVNGNIAGSHVPYAAEWNVVTISYSTTRSNQTAYKIGGSDVWYRSQEASVWSIWRKMANTEDFVQGLQIYDKRSSWSVATLPNSFEGFASSFGFVEAVTMGIPGAVDGVGTLLIVRGWSDNTGGPYTQTFYGSKMWVRQSDTGSNTWGAWKQIITSDELDTVQKWKLTKDDGQANDYNIADTGFDDFNNPVVCDVTRFHYIPDITGISHIPNGAAGPAYLVNLRNGITACQHLYMNTGAVYFRFCGDTSNTNAWVPWVCINTNLAEHKPVASDFDNMVAPGTFKLDDIAISNAPGEAGGGGEGLLEVVANTLDGSGLIKQHLTSFSMNMGWVRLYNGSWGSWTQTF